MMDEATDGQYELWTVKVPVVTHSGPSSVCRQFKLSGTMLSNAMSMSAIPGPHRPVFSVFSNTTPRAGHYGMIAHLAEHLRFRRHGRPLFSRSAVGNALSRHSPESKFSLMVSAAEVCWLQGFRCVSVVCECAEGFWKSELCERGTHT